MAQAQECVVAEADYQVIQRHIHVRNTVCPADKEFVDVLVNHAVMLVHYVLEDVQNLQCIAGLVQVVMVVFVHKVVEAEQVFVQLLQVYIAVIVQMVFVQQTEDQTVD